MATLLRFRGLHISLTLRAMLVGDLCPNMDIQVGKVKGVETRQTMIH